MRCNLYGGSRRTLALRGTSPSKQATDASEGLSKEGAYLALRHISANLLPSEKQVRYLDHLARQLGHASHREFITSVMPRLERVGPLTFNRALVHNAIDWAKARLTLHSRDTTAHQRRLKRDQAPG